jgi:MOSC domain-containing protein YiiM
VPGRIFQINISEGGVPKRAVHKAETGPLGIRGDGHRSKNHGGSEKALCLFSLERILELQAEGHPIFPGSTGENVTISGIDWETITPGCRLRLGRATEVVVTTYTEPCTKIRASFVRGDIERMDQRVHPGWARLYARIIRPGELKTGDPVEVLTNTE